MNRKPFRLRIQKSTLRPLTRESLSTVEGGVPPQISPDSVLSSPTLPLHAAHLRCDD